MKDDNYCLKIYSHISSLVCLVHAIGVSYLLLTRYPMGNCLILKEKLFQNLIILNPMGDFFYKIIPVGSTFNSKISV